MNKDERTAELKAKLTKVGRTDRIWTKGSFHEFPIFSAPTELLYLNHDNRRFRAEAQGAAEELDRQLDPIANPKDEKSIISLLLDGDPHVDGDVIVGKDSEDTRALKADWATRGQEKPFWIRPDGLVLNGNRRLAMIKREQEELGAETWAWVDVIIFDEDDYDTDVLFDLESTEQLTEGLKVRYSDINVLLTLREAAERENVDWADPKSIAAVAARIQHLVKNGASYAEIQLNAIKYMDLYLEDIEREGEYHLLRRSVERIRDVGKTMTKVAKDDPSREEQMLSVMFAMLRTGHTHDEIREIRRLWKTSPEDFDELASLLTQLEEEAEADTEPAEEEEQQVLIEEEEDEDEDEFDEVSPLAPDDYPKGAVKRALDTSVQNVKDSRQRDKRTHVLNAASRLEKISPADLEPHLQTGVEAESLSRALTTIIEWAEEMRPLLDAAKAQAPA